MERPGLSIGDRFQPLLPDRVQQRADEQAQADLPQLRHRVLGEELMHRPQVAPGAGGGRDQEDAGTDGREGERFPAPLLGEVEGLAQGLNELPLLVALAHLGPDGMDQPAIRQVAGLADHRVPRGDAAALGDDLPAVGQHDAARRLGDDRGHSPAVGQPAVGGIDDALHRLIEDVVDHHGESLAAAECFLFDDRSRHVLSVIFIVAN